MTTTPTYRLADGTECPGQTGGYCQGGCILDHRSEATARRDAARVRYTDATAHLENLAADAGRNAKSRARRAVHEASEDLTFWQGKVAAEAITAALPADPFEGLGS